MAVHRDFRKGDVRNSTPKYTWPFAALATVGIWAALLLASFYAPEPQPVLRWLGWLWGALATSFVILAAVKATRAGAPSQTPWIALALVSAGIWTAVYLVSVLAAVFASG